MVAKFASKSILTAVAVIALGGLAFGQAWSGILSPARAMDWSNAGASHVSDVRTQCGATIAAYSGTAGTINTALAACGANQFVLLGPGTFTISSAIVFANGSNPVSNVTLRGSGPNSTFLVFTGAASSYSFCANHHICAASSDTNNASSPSHTANWTAGYSQGATTITLSSVTGLAVSDPITLDQIDNQSDNGALYAGCEQPDGSTACYSGTGPTSFQRGSTLATIRGQQQMVTVASCDGNSTPGHACSSGTNITITPGLYAPNWNAVPGTSNPGAWWANNPIFNDGVENLSYNNSADGNFGIFFFNCSGCWAKNVRGILTSPAAGSGWGEVVFSLCNHCTVRDSYFYGTASTDNYVIAVDLASDALVENNIMQFPGTVQFYNSDCEGCVSAYNYSAGSWSGSANFQNQSNDYHGLSLYSLAEGNIGAGLYADGFHGTHNMNTLFRNRFDGRTMNNGGLTTTNTVPVLLNPGTRYQNIVGNVFGTIGYHTQYKCTPAVCTNKDLSIYFDGGAYFGASDALTDSTTVFWGNWDVKTNATRFCTANGVPIGACTGSERAELAPTYPGLTSPSTTLPASFYLSTKPAWWTAGKAWPAIGPDVTGGTVGQCSAGTDQTSEVITSAQCRALGAGNANAIGGGLVVSSPAMDCYLNVMGGTPNGIGSALSFNPSACYSAVPAQTIYRPTVSVDTGANAVINPANNYDGDVSTSASGIGNDDGSGPTGYAITYRGFPAVVGTPTSVTLYVRNSANVILATSAVAGADYSVDGGNTWVSIWIGSSHGNIGSPITDRVVLPIAQDFTKVQVRFFGAPDVCTPPNCGMTGHFFETWIQTQDSQSQFSGIFSGIVQ